MRDKKDFFDFYEKQQEVNDFVFDEDDIVASRIEDEDEDYVPSTIPTPTYDGENRLDYVEIMKDYRSGNETLKEKATEKVIRDLTGLVLYVIKKKYSNYSPKYYDDLVQSGEIGILTGLKDYDPEKSLPATYFYYFIVHEIQSFINDTVYRTTPYYSTNMKKINRAIAQFENLDMPYTRRDISIQTGIPLDTVEKVMNIMAGRSEVSLAAFGEQLESPIHLSPEEEYFRKEYSEFLTKTMGECLTKEEMLVLSYLFGIGNIEPTSLKNTAKLLKMSIDKVKKLRTLAFCKLRNSKLATVYSCGFRHEDLELDEEDSIVLFPHSQAINAANEMQEMEIEF